MKNISHLTPHKFAIFLLMFLWMPVLTFSQNPNLDVWAFSPFDPFGNQDKCGFSEDEARHQLTLLGDRWGYGYDHLLADLQRWQQSPYVKIDSLGASVQNRALWQLTITSEVEPTFPRKTIFIHARTHPGEVQGWWVTNEIINLLLSEDEFAQFLRERCVFYIVPMYNPDGVELERPRQNAHGIDIESNWDKNLVEPEVAVLRNRFAELMASEAPIEIALNMHSALACKRYFVYHAAAGTSTDFTLMQKDFIGAIRWYFATGIQPWNYFISWKSGTPPYYPESWFWNNFQEKVMALTYEDMNCVQAGEYDQTAFALLHGISDYLGLILTTVMSPVSPQPEAFSLKQNYPNPVRLSQNTTLATIIQYQLESPQSVRLVLYDVLGKELEVLDQGFRTATEHRVFFDASKLSNGLYFYQLQTATGIRTKQLTVVK
ncbi:MAG: M14 family zinc carboxypeptidase [bacterium]